MSQQMSVYSSNDLLSSCYNFSVLFGRILRLVAIFHVDEWQVVGCCGHARWQYVLSVTWFSSIVTWRQPGYQRSDSNYTNVTHDLDGFWKQYGHCVLIYISLCNSTFKLLSVNRMMDIISNVMTQSIFSIILTNMAANLGYQNCSCYLINYFETTIPLYCACYNTVQLPPRGLYMIHIFNV